MVLTDQFHSLTFADCVLCSRFLCRTQARLIVARPRRVRGRFLSGSSHNAPLLSVLPEQTLWLVLPGSGCRRVTHEHATVQ
jgi:hypothetical protein